MRKNLALAILIGLLCIALPVSAAEDPNIWHVSSGGEEADFTTIQAAILDDRIMPGDMIVILPGTYTRFDVYKPHLTIQSFEGPDSVTVDCAGIEIANREDATGTILDGLTIVNSQAGVRLGQYGPAPDSIVRNSVFNGMTNYVRSQGSNITFENNTFMNTAGTPSSNFQLRELANSNIVNNTFTNVVAKSGIFYFYSSEATNVTIAGNTFDSTFTGNTFYFRTAGEGNRIYLNSNVADVALHAGSTAPTTTYWNTTSPVTYTYNGVERTGYLGNHWLDYTGVDTNGDGIGDTPYALPDGLGTDYAPLMGAWENGVITGSEPALPYTVLYEGTVDIPAGSTIQAPISPKSGGYTPGEDFVEIPANSVGGMLDASGFVFDMWKSQKPVPTYSLQDITTPDGVYYPNVQSATEDLIWRSFDGMTSAATKYDPNVALENGTTIYTVYGDYNVVNSDPSGAQYVIVTTLNVVESEPEPATWYVDDDVDAGTDFTNIQDAVIAASPNDTIVVFSGTYGRFSFIGDKSYLTLQAIETDGPVIIDSTGSLRIPSGSGDNAVRTILDGFTFINAQPPFHLGHYGPASDSIVRNSQIIKTSTIGLQGGSTNLTLENNTFVDVRPGTALASILMVKDVPSSNIVNNTFVNITAKSGIFYFYSPEATGITIAGNTFDATVGGNTFYFRDAGEGNRIYLNNNVAGVALHAGSTAPTTTYWNTTSPVTYTYNGVERTGYLGNHWLDYTGVDTNGDGIGDTPYVLPDGLGTDYAPLMGAWENGAITGSEPALPYTVLYEGTVDIPAGSTIQAPISPKSGGYTSGEDFVEIPANSVGGMLDASGFVFDMWKSQKPVPTYSLQDITTPDGVYYPNVQSATEDLIWRSFDGMTSAAAKYDPNVALENGTTIYTVYGDYNVVNSDPSGAQYVIITTLNIVESEPEPTVFNTSVTVYADEPIVVDGTTYGGNTFFNILAAAGYTYTYAESESGFSDRKPLLTLTIDGVTYPTEDFGTDYAWKFYETLGTGDDYKYKKSLNGYIDGSGTYYIWYGDMSQFDFWELPSVENSTYVVELNVTLLPTRPSEDGTPAGVTIISPLPNSGYAVGASVRLAATATGDNLTYTWDLGNGDTVVGQDTSYAYPATGNYTITLTVANDAGSAEASTGITILDSDLPYIVLYEGTVDIPAGSTIQAAISPRSGGYTPGEDFVEIPAESVGGMLNASGFIFDMWKSQKPIPTYSLQDITTPDGVYYPNVQDATADLVWRSFDGMTAAARKYDTNIPLENGTTIYTVYGDYGVVNSDPSGAQYVIITTLNIVEPGTADQPVAGFTANTTSGDAPLVVAFIDNSTGAESWFWTFGDDETSSERNPVHTYTTPGTYTVTLMVTNAAGSDSATKTIVVTEPGEEADTIILRPGWNFVSTPKRLADGANTFALFDGVDTNARSILLYDGLDYDWKQVGLTDTFQPLDAVWIYANGTYTIPLTFAGGAAELPPTKDLGKGWNAIGFTDTVPESAAATLLSLGDSWATLIGYDAQDQRYERAIIRTSASETQEMQPMQGYWIYTTRAETIAAISG